MVYQHTSRKPKKQKTSDKDRIEQAFMVLRHRGWFARADWKCCQTCGCAAVPEGQSEHYIFYHHQDAEAFQRNRLRAGGMWLAHSGTHESYELVEALRNVGLEAYWDGSVMSRVWVGHKGDKYVA